MSHRSLLPVLAGVAALAGCGADPGEEGAALGTAGEAIMGGHDDAADTGVVDVFWVADSAECSGSLLAPNMVLTAHHCVAPVLLGGGDGVTCALASFGPTESPSSPPGNFSVSAAEVFTIPTEDAAGWHVASEVLTPPGGSAFCGNDQAIFILADLIPASEAKPLVPRVDGPVTEGEAYSAVGFGTTDEVNGGGQRRRLDGLLVRCTGKDCSAADISITHEWGGDHGICEGDSGGPALDADGRVIGVTSRGAAGCTSPIYGDVFSWSDWIKSSALHAAEVGGYTAPGWATGYPTDPIYSDPIGATASCASEAACPSGLCLGDSEGSYCTRACSTVAPCPAGYTCDALDQQQVCERVATPTSTKSGCSIEADDPTKPVPWSTGVAGLAALALLGRRRRR
jgi:MYXO-CTERM domain-containing protein